MKAAIIGYGKMGREIEKILIARGHEVALIIDINNASDLTAENLAKVDVAIEFTTPSTAYENIRAGQSVLANYSNSARRRVVPCSTHRTTRWALILCSASIVSWHVL